MVNMQQRKCTGPVRLTAARCIAVLFFTVMMILLPAWGLSSEIPGFPENTAGQRMLKQYAEQANLFLIQQGELGINSVFEAQRSMVVFGITSQPGEFLPEGVEITAMLYENSINTLQVRVNDFSRFPRIAASFIRALTPDSMSMKEALDEPTKRMQKASKAPKNSFADQVETLNGTVPYIYYAYYPNQYHEEVNWLQMTIVFPMEGYWDGRSIQSGTQVTDAPWVDEDQDADYEGYDSQDDYVHYEIFVTPTPEPDSAAAESYGQ